jgi:5-methylcytosine-specific restriction endonuclease McrA
MHLCNGCANELPISDFRLRNGRPAWRCRDCERDYQRKRYKENPEKYRKKSLDSAKKARHGKNTREQVLAKQRSYYHSKAKHRERAYNEAMKSDRPWEWRAKNLRRNITKEITADWLESTFMRQSGRCALSNRKIDVMSFHVDHIVQRSLGGSDNLCNLRLVCAEANLAKSGLTDDQLISLCKDILSAQIPELIGRAIMEAECGD